MEAARKIVELVVQMGHEVLTRHLLRDDAWRQTLITPQEVYLRDMRWLEQCDLFMAEVSGSSFGVGFEPVTFSEPHQERGLVLPADAVRKISLLITGIATRIARWRRIPILTK